jgi:hypothetical protein
LLPAAAIQKSQSNITFNQADSKTSLSEDAAPSAFVHLIKYEAPLIEGIQFVENQCYPNLIKSADGMSGYEVIGHFVQTIEYSKIMEKA